MFHTRSLWKGISVLSNLSNASGLTRKLGVPGKANTRTSQVHNDHSNRHYKTCFDFSFHFWRASFQFLQRELTTQRETLLPVRVVTIVRFACEGKLDLRNETFRNLFCSDPWHIESKSFCASFIVTLHQLKVFLKSSTQYHFCSTSE